MTAAISSTSKRSDEDIYAMIKGDPHGNVKQLWPSEKKTSKPLSLLFKQVVVATSPAVLVFKYVPKSRRENGDGPFSECITLEGVTNPITKLKETD